MATENKQAPTPPGDTTTANAAAASNGGFAQGRRYWLAWAVGVLGFIIAFRSGRDSSLAWVCTTLLVLPAVAVTWWGYRKRLISQGEAFVFGPFGWVVTDSGWRTLVVLFAIPKRIRHALVD